LGQPLAGGGVAWVDRQHLLQAPDALHVRLDHRTHPEPGLLVARVGLQYLFQKLPRLGFAASAGGGDGLLQ